MTGVRTWWTQFSSLQRRRIVLGALLAVALAARDAMLLLAAGSMLALSELAPSAPRATAA